MRGFFALIGLALLVASAVGAPLAWDGSYVLFTTLDEQVPYASHGRYYHTLLTVPVLVLSRMTSNMAVLTAAYTSMEAACPWIALGLSWLIVRRRNPSLFLWPALGIGLATLPGQFAFDSEGLAAVQLFWPLLLLLVLPGGRRRYIAIGALSLLQLLIYPVAMALFAAATLVCLTVARQFNDSRRANLGLACAFAALALLRFLAPRAAYDASLLEPDRLLATLSSSFRHSVVGAPLAAVLAAWAAGLMILISNRAARCGRVRTERLACALALLSVAGSGAILLPWAIDPARWAPAESFRFWALACSLPLMTMAVLDATRPEARSSREPSTVYQHALAANLAALIFLVVLSLQGIGWLNLRHRLERTLVEHRGDCVSSTDLDWMTATPLEYWTTPYYALVLQGRTPATLLLADDGCQSSDIRQRLRLAPWSIRERDHGWFDLRAAPARSTPD